MNNIRRIERTFKRVELLLVMCCLVCLVKSQTGPTLDLRPRNVKVTFANEFCLKASWDPPEAIDGCKDLEYYSKIPEMEDTEDSSEGYDPGTSTTIYPKIEGGTLKFFLQTWCNGKLQDEPVVVNVTTNPELVHDFQCALHSYTDANCSWTPSSHIPDLRLFYWIAPTEPSCVPLSLKECVISHHPDNVKRGCHISEDRLYKERVYFLFNGTQDNMSVRNTFKKWMDKNVRPPALKWEFVRDGDHLNISWTPPGIITDSWGYTINYTECNIRKIHTLTPGGVTSWRMPFSPDCRYSIKLKANMSDGETPWGDEKPYGDNTSRHALMMAAAVISPLLVAIILFLAFYAVRKYKEQLFPKVPEVPRSLFEDILDNNNKCPAEKLYIPEEEAEVTQICLVMEPQVTKLDAENPTQWE